MQQQSVIHDPYSVATPRQITEAAARRARLQRLHSFPVVTAVEVAHVEKVQPLPEAPKSAETWAQRQKRLHEFKEPWFSIVCELEPVYPRIETIQHVVAKHFGLTRNDLICGRRTKVVVLPRHIAMALCRLLTLKSFPEIGRRFGNRDHTVPIYAFRKIEALIKIDPTVSADFEALKAQLGGAGA